jgi:RimJ/RimL family protein N-acetyltransferase
MIVDIYRLEAGVAANLNAPPLPAGHKIRCWKPDHDGLPAAAARRLSNYFWWFLTRIGGFSRPDFAEFRIERTGQVLHRLIVTPRWYRFPFMAPDDLQIGNVWTAPEARREQLARIMMAEVHRRFGDRTIWYVTDCANEASAALARSCGYRLVARGRRTPRLGLPILAQYVVERAL